MRPLKAQYDPTALFEPEIIVGEQGQIRRQGPCLPERRLMAALLEGVLDDLEHDHKNRRETAMRSDRPNLVWGPRGHTQPLMKAQAYVLSEDRDWCLSFLNCCEHLGLHAGEVRNELRRKGLL